LTPGRGPLAEVARTVNPLALLDDFKGTPVVVG
jgi:hypothetical protein